MEPSEATVRTPSPEGTGTNLWLWSCRRMQDESQSVAAFAEGAIRPPKATANRAAKMSAAVTAATAAATVRAPAWVRGRRMRNMGVLLVGVGQRAYACCIR